LGVGCGVGLAGCVYVCYVLDVGVFDGVYIMVWCGGSPSVSASLPPPTGSPVRPAACRPGGWVAG